MLGLERSISLSPEHDQRMLQRAMMRFWKIDSIRGIFHSLKARNENNDMDEKDSKWTPISEWSCWED